MGAKFPAESAPRKRDLELPERVPAYVSSAIGAALLSISASSWREWTDSGVLPPPAPGFPPSSPRWKWETVQAWLDGKHRIADAPMPDLFAEGSPLLAGHRKRGAPMRPGHRKRGRKRKLQPAGEAIGADASEAGAPSDAAALRGNSPRRVGEPHEPA